MMYRPTTIFNSVAELQVVTTETKKGVLTKTYKTKDIIYCCFRSFGGTEKVSNNVIIVEDTAVVETWYRPDIEANSRLIVNNKTYEIINEPENIENRNQFMQFKVRAIKGGA